MSNMYNTINESFTQYAGAVLQSRALVDVRDCLKPSARQIFYSMLLNKLVHSKPYKKTANAVGLAMADFYIHGDSSCEGIIMRAAQDFAMRYPLVDVKGNMGSLIESGNWAAARYTESRLSEFTSILFEDIDKDTVSEWRDNYSGEKQYPAVLPSKGYYNIVNGTMGIGIGAASSIPQFNLREVNEALIKLLWNPDIDFEELYCAPDFATGGVILNEEQVKESLKKGEGFACKIRSVIEYDAKDNCFVVTEVPYSVYTQTISDELNGIIESEENPGIERYNDLTGKTPLIKIYLNKKANQSKILKYLYKNTSLQHHYGINMTMLENGRFPRVFGWKEALSQHLIHEKEVYTRGFNFELEKINDRLHIVEGLLIALASIEEVIQTIKTSTSTVLANQNLQKNFLLSERQAKAILDMKLARLAHLEVEKIQKEKKELEQEKNRIETILNDEVLFNKEIEKGFREVITKFGDNRRTKILNLKASDDEEVVEEKSLSVYLTSFGNIHILEDSTLMVQKRNKRGEKIPLYKGEYICGVVSGSTVDTLSLFSNIGKCHSVPLKDATPGSNMSDLLNLAANEKIVTMSVINKNTPNQYILFVTKEGTIKKTELSEFKTNRRGSAQAIKLKDGDTICSAILCNNERIGVLMTDGHFVIFDSKTVNPIGRVAAGVKGPKLEEGTYVACAKCLPHNTREIVSISSVGKASRTKIEEFSITSRTSKGVKIQKIDDEEMSSFTPVTDRKELLISSTAAIAKIALDSISLTGRGAVGVLALKLKGTEKIVEILEDKI